MSAMMGNALRNLVNEVRGLEFREQAIRAIIGNTNWECLMRRLEEAEREAFSIKPAALPPTSVAQEEDRR